MKLKSLYVATLIATLPVTSAFSAALERSNQSIQAFLEPGNYVEAGFNVTDQNISGATTNQLVGNFTNTTSNAYRNNSNKDIGSAGDTYFTPHISAKIQATNKISLGLIYDEPFKVNTKYETKLNYLTTPLSGGATPVGTGFNLDTKNISLIVGYQPMNGIILLD